MKKIDCFCVGGGGSDNGAGGGGGYTSTVLGASVTPGQQLSVIVASYVSASSVGEICSADCGHGTNGGSGGGSGAYYWDDIYLAGLTPGNGGSDGGDGGYCITTSEGVGIYPPGKGQGTTTRYFGESNGTLYAGGGGGIASYWYNWEGSDYKIGSGGAGGGGNGLSPGAANTGGGGGAFFVGGSGICIIRWGDQKS